MSQGEDSSDDASCAEDTSNGLSKKKISLKKKRGTPRVSPEKDAKVGDQEPTRLRSPSPKGKEPRAARGRSELARAKIRATLREDSWSDEEPAGVRVPYKASRWKDEASNKAKLQLPTEEGEAEAAPSSQINRKAWQALGGESVDDRIQVKESQAKEEEGPDEESHSENNQVGKDYETVVIKPKEKKRGRKPKESQEPSPAPASPAPMNHQLVQDNEETKVASRTPGNRSRQSRLMEDLFDDDDDPSPKVSKGRKRRGVKESTDSEEPLSQRVSGRRKSGRSEGSEPSSLSTSPVREKSTAAVEASNVEPEEEPQKSKRRGRPSKKDKRNEIPEDVMEAMREVNGLRGRRSNKANKNEEPQGPEPDQSDSADVEAENEEASPPSENVPSKGHSLIVKSRNSKNKVSLVIKPIGSSTEETFESNTEETPESMNEDHVKSSSEESPKPAENNESSSSRPMEDGSRLVQQNDLLSKLV